VRLRSDRQQPTLKSSAGRKTTAFSSCTFLKDKGFVVTTWKEAAERRKRLAVEEGPTIGNICVAGLLPRLGRWDSLLSETAPFVVLWLFLYRMCRTRSFVKI
jgi:hypothetical protein